MRSYSQRTIRGLIFAMAVSSCGHFGVACDDGGQSKAAGNRKATPAKATTARISDVEIDTAMKFAKKHHPELSRLLEQLRKKSSSEFNRGIRDVHLAALRLERYRVKQPARFESGIRSWKRDSEIRLLSARWIVSGDSKLEKKIQTLLRQRQESRIEQLKAEKRRISDRLRQVERQINMSTAEMEAALDAEWEKLQKRAAAARKSSGGARRSTLRKNEDKEKSKRDTSKSKG